jgi:sugar fermentation stimulation protein A
MGGEIVTAHCPNTGAMTGCAEPGFTCWLSESDNPKRKLAYTWELAINNQGHWIGINTHRANAIVKQAIEEDRIKALSGYSQIRSEVKYGSQNSRIDILLSAPHKSDCYVEVKSVTLLDGTMGYFPDAKTTRGTKHLEELIEMVELGHRAVLFFCVQHTGIKQVAVAQHIDPAYASTLERALACGVELLVYDCVINEEKIALNQQLDFILQKKG